MNIGFIEDTHLHGGTQIWVTEAMRAFQDRGQELTLLAPEDSWVVKQTQDLNASTFTYDWDAVVNEQPEHIEVWTKALDNCDVAICTVHPPREGFHCSVFAARCIREANLSTHLIPKTGTIVPEYLREFYRPDENINSSVIAIADFTRQYLIDHYKIPEEFVALVYQGVDVDRFTPSEASHVEALKRYPLPKDAAPILGSIGSLEHRKGHPVLFEAIAELVKGPLPNIHLMLAGDGPDEEKLEQQVHDLELDDHIHFFPFTSEPNYVFERIDIAVLPSIYKEGLPNVLQEAMAMHVPVVSSNLGGVPEIVIEGQTGYAVEPGDSQALAAAIQKLWEDQEAYKRMQQASRRLIAENFDKQKQFDAFLEHFQKLTSRQ
ncbi:MAG: glycosyltransferase family 1 protein [Chloroflexi bacterium]|nr:MAG: glycosyltransferase family 1 protein [Chloroflexota bacterium]MBL1194003.1 glycosyltransferase family 1 protein [Chloroflexota bacterium]NOH11297.1 glycosyltransferase family 4 protein [Chloroflexota bacterium]